MAKQPKPKPPAANPSPQEGRCAAIVLVDAAPLRSETLAACRLKIEKLRTLRLDYERFERHDRPGFERWKAALFGAEMTLLRELEAEVQQLGMLISDVEKISFFENIPPHKAYQRLLIEKEDFEQRQASGHEDEAEPNEPEWTPPPDETEMPSGEDLKKIFEFTVLSTMGMPVGFLPKQLVREMFKQFRESFEKRAFQGGKTRPNPDDAEPPRRRRGRMPKQQPAPEPEPANPLKALYRKLVRRLHPDTRADSDPNVAHLWHEVQEAYQAEDLTRLETLVALTDLIEGSGMESTPLSAMKAVLKNLDRSIRAIQKTIRQAKKDPAWGFAARDNHSSEKIRIKAAFKKEIARLTEERDQMKSIVDRWEAKIKKTARVNGTTRRKAGSKPTKCRGSVDGGDPSLRCEFQF